MKTFVNSLLTVMAISTVSAMPAFASGPSFDCSVQQKLENETKETRYNVSDIH
jgi:hypothetical protein